VKLARYATSNRHLRPPGRNQQIANSLERELHKLEQLTAARRAEIAELIYSDRAAVVAELQEESKMLHLELIRLQKTKQDTENQLRKVAAELQDFAQKYSPAVLERQHGQIKSLEREIATQQSKNATLKEKVMMLRAAQESEENAREAARTQAAIDELKAQIRREQQEIAALDKQMVQMKDDHANEMQQLQSQL
jgi:predicted RNase H-like nuclease (RuvC/YqgF family)